MLYFSSPIVKQASAFYNSSSNLHLILFFPAAATLSCSLSSSPRSNQQQLKPLPFLFVFFLSSRASCCCSPSSFFFLPRTSLPRVSTLASKLQPLLCQQRDHHPFPSAPSTRPAARELRCHIRRRRRPRARRGRCRHGRQRRVADGTTSSTASRSPDLANDLANPALNVLVLPT